jgi:hypothetical protein
VVHETTTLAHRDAVGWEPSTASRAEIESANSLVALTLSLSINVKEECLLECLMNVPGRCFALSYEKTISWPESGLFSIPIGDSDPTFCDGAILRERIN